MNTAAARDERTGEYLDIVNSWAPKPEDAPVIRINGVSKVVVLPPADPSKEPAVIARATLVLNELVRVRGIVIERSASGRAIVRFPVAAVTGNRPVEVLQPQDEAARRDIESAIFAALRDKGFLLIERGDVTLVSSDKSERGHTAPPSRPEPPETLRNERSSEVSP